MQSPASDAGAKSRRGRLTLLAIFALCAAPLVASYTLYNFWRPTALTNYGELLEPQPLPGAALARPDGQPFRLSELKGEWVLVTVGGGACDDTCRRNLVYTRQVRLAQGRETDRVERVWIVTDAAVPDPALIAQHEGLIVVRDPQASVSGALPATRTPAEHIYVIDPLGNLMMRFPPNPDGRAMLKDIARLLRHSKWK